MGSTPFGFQLWGKRNALGDVAPVRGAGRPPPPGISSLFLSSVYGIFCLFSICISKSPSLKPGLSFLHSADLVPFLIFYIVSFFHFIPYLKVVFRILFVAYKQITIFSRILTTKTAFFAHFPD